MTTPAKLGFGNDKMDVQWWQNLSSSLFHSFGVLAAVLLLLSTLCGVIAAAGRAGEWYFGTMVNDKEKRQAATSGVLLPSKGSSDVKLDDNVWIWRWGGKEFAFLPIVNEELGLHIRRVDGQLTITAELRDETGNIIAKLVDNEWTLNEGNYYQRNYTDNALEVLGRNGKVVFQLQIDGHVLELQGVFFRPDGSCIAFMNVGPDGQPAPMIYPVTKYEVAALPEIAPVFRYPSDRYFGQLVQPTKSPSSAKTDPPLRSDKNRIGSVPARANTETLTKEIAILEKRIEQLQRADGKELIKRYPFGYVFIGAVHGHFLLDNSSMPAASQMEFNADWQNASIDVDRTTRYALVTIPNASWKTSAWHAPSFTLEQHLPLIVHHVAKVGISAPNQPSMYFEVLDDNPDQPIVLIGFKIPETN